MFILKRVAMNGSRIKVEIEMKDELFDDGTEVNAGQVAAALV